MEVINHVRCKIILPLVFNLVAKVEAFFNESSSENISCKSNSNVWLEKFYNFQNILIMTNSYAYIITNLKFMVLL